jgi:hypothetical protein
LVVSRDGRHVYAAVRDSGAVAAFRRDRRTGALRQLAGRRGCLGGAAADGCAAARNLDGARALTLSRDGRSVYVASARGLAVLARDRRSGALRQLAGRDGCVTVSGRQGCAAGRAVASALWVAAGREGRSLYLLGRSDAVAVFRRDPRSGAVRQQNPDSAWTTCRSGRPLSPRPLSANRPRRRDPESAPRPSTQPRVCGRPMGPRWDLELRQTRRTSQFLAVGWQSLLSLIPVICRALQAVASSRLRPGQDSNLRPAA